MGKVKYNFGRIDKIKKAKKGDTIDWDALDRYLRFEKRYSDYNTF